MGDSKVISFKFDAEKKKKIDRMLAYKEYTTGEELTLSELIRAGLDEQMEELEENLEGFEAELPA